jgi:hypothetical protein
MKKILTSCALAAMASGCASFSATLPPEMKPVSVDTPYVQSLVELQNTYVKKATALNGEALWINGLATTATVAALGFTSFDAHADNFKAATLISGSALVANNQLKPSENARLMIGAANSVRCLINNLRNSSAAPSAMVSIQSSQILDAMKLGSSLTYETVDMGLVYALSLAAAVESPTPRLQAAKLKAEAARARLKTAIVARGNFAKEAFIVQSKIEAAVNAMKPPSLADLLQKLGEVKVPEKPEPVQSGGDSTKKALAAFAAGAQDGGDASAAFALELLVGATDSLDPEKETEATKAIQACLGAMTVN